MGDIDKTIRVGVVTPVNPGRSSGRRKGGPQRQPAAERDPNQKPRPPSDGDGHKVDDYA